MIRGGGDSKIQEKQIKKKGISKKRREHCSLKKLILEVKGTQYREKEGKKELKKEDLKGIQGRDPKKNRCNGTTWKREKLNKGSKKKSKQK